MNRIPVTSSDLVSVGYDELARVLEIEFKENRIYQYSDVPPDIYKGLMRADSPGRYFFAHINAYFRYRRISGEAAPPSQTLQPAGPKTITFVTGNQRKLRHMRKACLLAGIRFQHMAADIDEIQAHDPMRIALHKADEAFKLCGGVPVAVNDAFWSIPALNGFPGGYMKDVIQWLTAEDFLNLMRDKPDRSVVVTETLIYKDKDQIKTFTCEVQGTFTDAPRGPGNSMEQVIELADSGKTLAELHEAGEYEWSSGNTIWTDFATWYAES